MNIINVMELLNMRKQVFMTIILGEFEGYLYLGCIDLAISKIPVFYAIDTMTKKKVPNKKDAVSAIISSLSNGSNYVLMKDNIKTKVVDNFNISNVFTWHTFAYELSEVGYN